MTVAAVSIPTESNETLWQRHARQWDRLGPPLRPSGDDLVWAQAAIDDCARRRGPDRMLALLLGVTPSLAKLVWPGGSRLLAADLSMAMIESVWPGDGEARWAVCADWLQLPLAPHSCDLVLADGCFLIFDPLAGAQFARAIHGVLRPGGVLSARVYLRPEMEEGPETVWQALFAGRIGSMHVFKFRLLAALSGADGQVCVGDAWEFVRSRLPADGGLELLASRLGWPVEDVLTLEAYRDQPTLYRFFTEAEFREMTAGLFAEAACLKPRYEMGERFPTFVLTRR